ncbi:hypothetical protein [uncultured Tenacibaculum sp.]|uniref:DUF7660 family protein n=1 Tax=uncultured Tenacibaculum sp. TaxID=174713 RepID=UPI0026065DA6|nr:hypothetical protein [uncultured Tenacibaculum sp.]
MLEILTYIRYIGLTKIEKEILENTMTRIEFIDFLKEFRKDLKENKSNWENKTLEDFIEAMEVYTEDIQGYYDNMKMNIDADKPTWQNFKTILEGVKIYE